MLRSRGCGRLACVVLLGAAAIRAQEHMPVNPAAREILKQLVEINTTDSTGSVTAAAAAMAARFRAAGFPEQDVVVAGPGEHKRNLVVRYHGSGRRKPVLFIGHLDVVEARREDWSLDPLALTEKDGMFYGRGTEDMKQGDAMLVANFVRLKQEGFVPDRDLILALTADEEGGTANGVDWLLKNHRDWIDAEYCINLDGGEFAKKKDKRLYAAIQASEKVYGDFQFESRNPGGHSSVPSPDNAIYHLAGALARLQKFSFPVRINEITRNYFAKTAIVSAGQLAKDLAGAAQLPPDPAAIRRLSEDRYFNSLLRTTCVATELSGGHAPNALPQQARANINCRIFPGDDPAEVRSTLERVAADEKVTVAAVPERTADGKEIPVVTVPASPLLPALTEVMERTVKGMWGDLPVVPVMATGASDGKFTRIAGIPTYGIACLFVDVENNSAHGRDEHIGAEDFYDGVEFNYRLIKALGQ